MPRSTCSGKGRRLVGRTRFILLVQLVWAPAALGAQGQRLTVETIMRGPDFAGTAPSDVRFSCDGKYVYFRWRGAGVDTLDQDYRAAVRGGGPERLPRFAVDTIAMDDGAWSPDNKREVVVLKGDLYLVDRSGAKRRLTQTAAPESDPSWSGDGRTVYFRRDDNAWALALDGGAERQLTDIRHGPAPKKAEEPAGQKRVLRDQQQELFDFIRRQVALEKLRADTDTVATMKSVYVAERHAVSRLEVAPDGRVVLLTVTERPEGDTLERRVVAHLHDDAWLDGPLGLRDAREDDVTGTAGWLADGETVYYGSEETGWAHVYTVPARGGAPRALTSGEWEVQRADLSADRRVLYLHTNEGDFGQVHFSAVDPATGAKTPLTTAEGRQDVVASSDRSLLAVLHSTANHPPELYLQPARAGAAMRQVTESTTPQWRGFAWSRPEIVMVPARDGVKVPARLYRPSGAANRAAVIFVHGAGYLQNVHKWWSFYYREYMFHHLLASRGYTVLDLDYRGSAGHGRAWRTAIYRHMGGADLDDQVDGARWLVRQLGIDSTRVGIYGGSYGGFITLVAVFTRPRGFAAGGGPRPVTGWAPYKPPLTARLPNQPPMDKVAY